MAIPLLCQADRTGLFCKNKIHLAGGSTTCTHTWGHPRGLSRGYHLPFPVFSLVSAECTLQARPGPHPPAAFHVAGSLWCFPEFPTDKSIEISLLEKYGYKLKDKIEFKTFKHTFSHFHLSIKPVHIRLKTQTNRINDARLSTWVKLEANHQLGFPAPVVSILKNLNNSKRIVLNES